jgi:hypothetical protein
MQNEGEPGNTQGVLSLERRVVDIRVRHHRHGKPLLHRVLYHLLSSESGFKLIVFSL